MTEKAAKSFFIGYVGAAAILVIYSGISMVKAIRVEREKRKKIELWKEENIACIHNSYERLNGILDSDDFTWEKLAKAMKEENEFLRIVREQPKY